MLPSSLVVSPHPGFLLGMAQALLKFGYRVDTARPDPGDLERAAGDRPDLVLLHPPVQEAARRRCLECIRSRFVEHGVPVLACVAGPEEAREVQASVRGVHLLPGNPVRLSHLYATLQELQDLPRRRELRIHVELAVAHREAALRRQDFFYYDTMTSLSLGGCFIRTPAPYPVGRQAEMVFCAGLGSRSLRLRGRVCYHGQGSAGRRDGMGIQFEALSDPERTGLESFLLDQVRTPGLPVTL